MELEVAVSVKLQAAGLPGDWGLTRAGPASRCHLIVQAFSLIDLQTLCNEQTLYGLTAWPNLTIAIELCKISQAKPLPIMIWLTHTRLEDKQTAL